MQRKHEAIRDPIHKWIKFSPEEKAIIDSPFVQRLRWISQLTSAEHVFPGGTHTRFIHSLGAMHLAGKYMRSLFKNTDCPMNSYPAVNEIWKDHQKYIQMARIAALLHDVGHGPFSHAYDRSIYKKIYNIEDGGHDHHRLKIVMSHLIAPLIRECGVTPEEIILCWNPPEGNNIYRVINAVVQGPLGADRMDFTLRDSYFTGTEHFGTISPQRIISNSLIYAAFPNTEHFSLHLTYNIKVITDIIQALDGRFRMYDCVYLHKTVFASGVLVEKIMEKACEPLHLVERTQNLEEFIDINDYTLIGEIMASNSKDLIETKKYCQKFLRRELPKLTSETIVCEMADYKTTDDEVSSTKHIGGINPAAFTRAGICFLNENGDLLSCQGALDSIKYIPSQKSFHYERRYQFN
jgi:HD superfamily phosphohydrolase